VYSLNSPQRKTTKVIINVYLIFRSFKEAFLIKPSTQTLGPFVWLLSFIFIQRKQTTICDMRIYHFNYLLSWKFYLFYINGNLVKIHMVYHIWKSSIAYWPFAFCVKKYEDLTRGCSICFCYLICVDHFNK